VGRENRCRNRGVRRPPPGGTIHPYTGGGEPDSRPDAIHIVRDFSISGPTDHPLDLAGAVSTEYGYAQIYPGATSPFVVFRTANRASALLGRGGFNATDFDFAVVPLSYQRPGDIHELEVRQSQETRRIFFRRPVNPLVDFNRDTPLAWSTFMVRDEESTAITSHRRLTLTADQVPGYVGGYEIVLESRTEVDPPQRWTTFVTTRWLEASALGCDGAVLRAGDAVFVVEVSEAAQAGGETRRFRAGRRRSPGSAGRSSARPWNRPRSC
jgi:hypothetical protein